MTSNQCIQCKIVVKSASALKTHLNTEKHGAECSKCHVYFKNNHGLMTHMGIAHKNQQMHQIVIPPKLSPIPTPDPPNFQSLSPPSETISNCPDCTQVFSSDAELKIHLNEKSHGCECSKCHKFLKNVHGLKIHMGKTHKEHHPPKEKNSLPRPPPIPFLSPLPKSIPPKSKEAHDFSSLPKTDNSCPDCTKIFSSDVELKFHLNDKFHGYECYECQSYFKSERGRNIHVTLVHRVKLESCSLPLLPSSVKDDSKFTLIHFNCNGYATRKPYLTEYLKGKNNCIIALNDTRLNLDIGRSTRQQTKIEGFTFYRDTFFGDGHAGGAGGVAFLVPSDLKVKTLTIFNKYNLDAFAILVDLPGDMPSIKLATYYNHPYNPTSKHQTIRTLSKAAFQDFFECEMGKGIRGKILQNPIGILCGDLNSNHEDFGSSKTDHNGVVLKEIMEDLELLPLNPKDPTRPISENVLDFAICNSKTKKFVTNCWIEKDLGGSDHLPIIVEMDFSKKRYDALKAEE